ncbi:MAG: type IX secretion system sortase PorU [Coprobacter sp.]|nr:type IX secretion system sortase PorU [Coprobacter sp.]
MRHRTLFNPALSLLLLLTLFAAGHLSVQAATGEAAYTRHSKLESGLWVRVSVPDNGIYQISYDDLRKWGFSDPAKVKVHGYGGKMLSEDFSAPYTDDLPEIPVYHHNGRILFYAQGIVSWKYDAAKQMFVHERHAYSVAGHYFLTQNDDEPVTFEPDNTPDNAALTPVTVFDDYALYETESVNLGKTGRVFYGEDFRYTTQRTFSFDIPGMTEETRTVRMQVDFAAKATSTSQLTLLHNGSQINRYTIKAITSKNDLSYKNAELLSTDDEWESDLSATDKITLDYKGTDVRNANLDFIRLTFRRQLQLYGNKVQFRNIEAQSRPMRYAINTAAPLQIWDITDPVHPRTIPAKSQNGKYSFTARETGLKEYIAFNPGGTFPSVTFVETVANQNLHGWERADLTILVPPALAGEAERLARHHESKDNLSCRIVFPQQIYNEFSSGTPDATAIRRFMKMFYDRAGDDESQRPRYLLLFGDGTYDNRLISSEWSNFKDNFIISYQSVSGLNERNSYVSDDYFGFLDDHEGVNLASDQLDIGIGRFPVRTLDEAQIAVDKVIAYANSTDFGIWKNNLCFVADDGNASQHMITSNKLTDLIETNQPEFYCNKIYIDAFNKVTSTSGSTYPDAKKKFFDLLDDGLLLVNYCGHGSTKGWTAEKILELNDIQKMYLKRLPLFITATCDFSRFDDIAYSGGEYMFLNPKGGAIAMFTTTRVVESYGNELMNIGLISHLFDRDGNGERLRMGDIMKLAKRSITGSNENKLNFVLLGDPALQLAYPEHKLVVTEIDGQPVDDTSASDIQFKARAMVEVKGEIRHFGNNEKMTGYNGIIYPRLYDSQTTVTTHGNGTDGSDMTGTPYTFKERTNLLYTSKEYITDGEFSFRFKMPKELNYSNEAGYLNLYAGSVEDGEAFGACSHFIIGGSDNTAAEDHEGPVIHTMYLNTSGFKDGDTVNENPVFFAEVEDPSGINLSGIGMGHNMTINIDDSEYTEYVLNSYFDPEPGVYGKGNVMFEIPALPDGEHLLTFKIWDTEGNSSEKTLTFISRKGMKPHIFEMYVDKNPVRDVARFYIRHDRPNTNMYVSMYIYNLFGEQVWTFKDEGKSDMWTSPVIQWNLTDNAGRRVNPGVYVYKAMISTDDEHEATQAKKIIVLGQ